MVHSAPHGTAAPPPVMLPEATIAAESVGRAASVPLTTVSQAQVGRPDGLGAQERLGRVPTVRVLGEGRLGGCSLQVHRQARFTRTDVRVGRAGLNRPAEPEQKQNDEEQLTHWPPD